MSRVDAPDLHDLRQQVADGLLYAHTWLTSNTAKALESAGFLYALIELLNERGVISIEDLDERKRVVARRLADQLQQTGPGVMVQDPEYDKYAFKSEVEIDCASRVEFCHAACCRLPFALSKQDIREGIVHWDLSRPYLIQQEEDGYCCHLDRGEQRCTVRENRPVPCRAFDCRGDNQIWLDFDQKIANPAILRPDWPRCLVPENASKPEP